MKAPKQKQSLKTPIKRHDSSSWQGAYIEMVPESSLQLWKKKHVLERAVKLWKKQVVAEKEQGPANKVQFRLHNASP